MENSPIDSKNQIFSASGGVNAIGIDKNDGFSDNVMENSPIDSKNQFFSASGGVNALGIDKNNGLSDNAMENSLMDSNKMILPERNHDDDLPIKLYVSHMKKTKKLNGSASFSGKYGKFQVSEDVKTLEIDNFGGSSDDVMENSLIDSNKMKLPQTNQGDEEFSSGEDLPIKFYARHMKKSKKMNVSASFAEKGGSFSTSEGASSLGIDKKDGFSDNMIGISLIDSIKTPFCGEKATQMTLPQNNHGNEGFSSIEDLPIKFFARHMKKKVKKSNGSVLFSGKDRLLPALDDVVSVQVQETFLTDSNKIQSYDEGNDLPIKIYSRPGKNTTVKVNSRIVRAFEDAQTPEIEPVDGVSDNVIETSSVDSTVYGFTRETISSCDEGSVRMKMLQENHADEATPAENDLPIKVYARPRKKTTGKEKAVEGTSASCFSSIMVNGRGLTQMFRAQSFHVKEDPSNHVDGRTSSECPSSDQVDINPIPELFHSNQGTLSSVGTEEGQIEKKSTVNISNIQVESCSENISSISLGHTDEDVMEKRSTENISSIQVDSCPENASSISLVQADGELMDKKSTEDISPIQVDSCPENVSSISQGQADKDPIEIVANKKLLGDFKTIQVDKSASNNILPMNNAEELSTQNFSLMQSDSRSVKETETNLLREGRFPENDSLVFSADNTTSSQFDTNSWSNIEEDSIRTIQESIVMIAETSSVGAGDSCEQQKGSVKKVNSTQKPLRVAPKRKMELKMSKKIALSKLPSNIRELLATGLLEGLPVKYLAHSFDKQGELRGIIKGGGILCYCDSCNGLNTVSAYNFELHAGSKKKRPSDFIRLENGNTLHDILKACLSAPLDLLESTIQNAISLEGRNIFSAEKINESLTTSNHCTVRASRSISSAKSSESLPKPSSLQKSGRGRVTTKDLRLHKLVFMDDILPEGTEVGYYTRGQRLLGGYIKDSGIFCHCCNTVVSPSQFEAHAGWASRRKPYLNIYTSNGVSLHELSVSLSKGRKFSSSESDDLCRICGEGGDLLLCDICPRAYHKECVGMESVPTGDWYCPSCQNMQVKDKTLENNENAIAAGRIAGIDPIAEIFKRCIRIAKTPQADVGGCVLCRGHDFSRGEFGPRTVLLCDQCEREFHVGCLKENNLGDLKELPEGKWFCSSDCERIHDKLQMFLSSGPENLPICLSDVILKKKLDDLAPGVENELDIRWRILSGKSATPETRSFLSKALSIFYESFDPIIDFATRKDLIPAMVYGWDLRDQDFGGMFCAVLTVNSCVVSAAILRVLGCEVAELPLVATSREYQGKGYFQALFSCIEALLDALKVKHLVLPAADEAEAIWTNKFGFSKISIDQLNEFMKGIRTLIFEGTSLLHKPVVGPTKAQDRADGS